MSLEEFRFLNPAHNKPVIKADGSETIVLPVDKVAVFEKNLETHDRPLVSWQAYTMKRSDQPEKIAAKHGMTLAELKAANNVPGNKKIVAGQTLLVPLRGNADPHLPDLPAPQGDPHAQPAAAGEVLPGEQQRRQETGGLRPQSRQEEDCNSGCQAACEAD